MNISVSVDEPMKSVTPPRRPRMPDDYDRRRGFKLSLGLHVGLALFILIKTLVFPGNPTPFIPALRVDLVGLPDQLKNEIIHNAKSAAAPVVDSKPQPEEKKASKPVKTEEMAEPDEMVMKPHQKSVDRQKKIQSALARIKALEKISGQDSNSKARDAAQALLKGNRISKGSSLSGEAREAAVASYYDVLRERLQENWELPLWLSKQSLAAQVQLYIDAYGRVQSLRFVKSSGNPQFDEAVKRAISDSQPFEPPPSELASTTLSDGILVGFPL